MTDQREYPPGREQPPGGPTAVPAGRPQRGARPPAAAGAHPVPAGARPVPAGPRPGVAPPVPPGRPVPVPARPQPAGAVPLLTHDAAGGRWTPAGYGNESYGAHGFGPGSLGPGAMGPGGMAPGGMGANGGPPGPGQPPPGYGAVPPPVPPGYGDVAPADRPPGHPAAGPGGGGPRWRRRLLRTLVVLLGVAVLAPVVAFLIGWVVFDVPSADQAAVTQVATFQYADGAALATIRPDNVNRTIVPLDQVPEHVRQAVLAAEDRSFYSNPGFDLSGIGRALWNQATGGVGGGSTITQQYVKVSTGQDQVSLLRKYKEIVLAVKISQEQSKDEILENYLNVIYLGRGAYGIQAASQAYFGKDVKDLSVSEGAMLAGTIQSPSRWDPAKNIDKSTERWNFVLDGMAAQGWVTPVDRALQRFPEFLPEPPPVAGIPGDAGGHVYNLAKQELESRGITEQEINTEGLTIELTIDSKRQEQAVAAVTKVLEARGMPDNLRGALVSVDPKTGAILAYYGGENGVGTDYAQAMRQPGSSFKPFVLSAALQDSRQNVGLGSTYDGSSPQEFLGIEVSNSEGFNCDRCSVQTAMTKSINTVFYKMGIDVGPQRVVDAAHQAGIPTEELPNPTAGISLGDKEVRAIDMASAFATFAADGMRREPYLVAKVTTADGRVLYEHPAAAGEQVVPQPVARNVTEAMKDVPASGNIAPSGGRPVAGKTGTVQHPDLEGQNKDAWMVGYTPSVSTAVWVGTDRSDPIRNAAGRPVFGRMLPGSIWQTFMNGALRGTPAEQFSRFVPLGTPPGAGDEATDDDESEDSDGRSDDDDDDDESDSRSGDSDGDSGDSDSGDSGGSGDSDSSRRSDSGDDSDRSDGDSGSDSRDDNAVFDPGEFDLPGLGGGSPARFTDARPGPSSGPPAA